MPASFGAVAFETLAPLLLLAPARFASVPFALFGITFHYGIALLQNIDFVSWWAPAYAFLLVDPAAWSAGLLGCPADSDALGRRRRWRRRSRRTRCASLSLAYVALHVAAVVARRFFPHLEILPLSSFPMFGSPHNLFDKTLRKNVWLTDKAHVPARSRTSPSPSAARRRSSPPSSAASRSSTSSSPTAVSTRRPAPLAPRSGVRRRRRCGLLDEIARLGAQEAHLCNRRVRSAGGARRADAAKAAFREAPRPRRRKPSRRRPTALGTDESEGGGDG